MSIDMDIKSQEDELKALKGVQIIAGSKVIVYTTTSQVFNVSVPRMGAGAERTVVFTPSVGQNPHLISLSISNLSKVSGGVSLRTFSCYQLPQVIGSTTISLRINFYGVGGESDTPAVYSFRVNAFGDATGTFTIS